MSVATEEAPAEQQTLDSVGDDSATQTGSDSDTHEPEQQAQIEQKPEPEPPPQFEFIPAVGDDRSPIKLPLDFNKPDFDKPEDRIWLFDLADLPPHERMWVWLRRAQIPRFLAHRVVALPIEEQAKCIENWLRAAQGVGAGE